MNRSTFIMSFIVAGMLCIALALLGCENPTAQETYDFSGLACYPSLACPRPRAGFCCPEGYSWTGTKSGDERCYKNEQSCKDYYKSDCVKCQ